MMRNLLLLFAATIAVAGAACAPAAPTVDPAFIQASAVAAASTMVAMTQQAIPTATQVPPTPLPSPTAFPSPTLGVIPTLPLGASTAALAPTTSLDACNAPMAAETDGPLATVRIANNTDGDVVLSLYLYKTAFGECGYRGFNLAPRGSTTATNLPQGCYFAGAFVNTSKQQTKSFGNGCINSDRGVVLVGTEVISIASN
ncbi:MAG: hypothetical protein V1755_13945 [Chloroflexota bacterium]